MTRLSDVAGDGALAKAWPAVARAASLVGSPPLRNVGTLGGNLCLDTRCTYWNQTHEWRRSIGFCLKKDGDTCWVAPGSARCWAVSSSDTAPVLCAIGAEATLVSRAGERRVPVADLFADDGIRHLSVRSGEVLSAVHLPAPAAGDRSAYVKLRRRESIDFPVLGVAVHARVASSAGGAGGEGGGGVGTGSGVGTGGVVESARIFLGGVGSRPQEAREASEFLRGKSLADGAVIEEAARLAAKVAKPLQNTDFELGWRKGVAREHVARALQGLG